MDKYEEWMKQWNTYKFNWTESEESIKAFVLNVIPPEGGYSTMLHFELALEIDRYIGLQTRINQKEKCIQIYHGSHIKPSIYFHDEDVSSRYPWSVNYSMSASAMTATKDPIDVQDEFGFISLRLEDFRRVYILKLVKVLKSMGFAVLHGVVSSGTRSIGESSRRLYTKIPSVDDPIWNYI